MAGSVGRSLVVGLRAETTQFNRELKGAQKEMAKFKDGLSKIGKAVTASFVAMGAAATAFGMDAIKAAIDDQKEMIQLRKVVENNVKSQKDLSAAVEKSVSAMQMQYGVSDGKLRKGFGKLILATKNVSKSQKLMRVAMDISAGTGKDLETVTTAMSKAYLGNNTALGKLGIGISKVQLKTMTFDRLMALVEKRLGGSAKAAASSFEGKMNKLNQRFQTFKENIGYKLMPVAMKFMDWIEKRGIPALESFAGVFTGDKGANQAIKDGTTYARNFGLQVQSIIRWIIKNKDYVIGFGKALAGLWALGKVASFINTINKITNAFRLLRGAALGAAAAENAALGGGAVGAGLRLAGRGVAAIGGAAVATAAGAGYVGHKIYSKGLGFNGQQDPRNRTLLDIRARESALFMQPNRTSAQSRQLANLQAAEKQVQAVNITINGAIDVQGTARQIQKILQQNSLTGFPIQTVGTPVPKK